MVEQLFNRTLAVALKAADRDDTKKVHIKVTVELQTITTPLHKKDLVVRLTDESDPYFLYSLSIGDEDFQSLKAQQGLLVDFTAFPQKFIDLLDLCLQEETKESPKFLLQLITAGGIDRGLANLSVVETNPFKHLTHLSLKFVPGNDSDIKKYLAACLKKLKEEKSALENRLSATESELNHRLKQTQEALSAKTIELDNMRAEWSSKASNLTAKHAQEMTAHKEKALQAQTEVQHKYDRDRKEMEESHRKAVQQFESRLADLESTNKDLTDLKYRHESTIRELQSKNNTLGEECERTKQDLQNLRRENTSLDTECHDRDKSMNQLRTRVAVLEQEVKDKDHVVARTTDLLNAAQEQKNKLEESLEQKSIQCHKLEKNMKTSSDEVMKGNEIIKRLQGDLKASMAKMKLKNTVTTQQEKLLAEKEQQVEKQSDELRTEKENLKIRDEENKKLSESLESTMQKLEESKQLLKTNENVINWLNKQVNEAQISHRHGTFEMPSATTAFKPTVNNPPSSVHYNPMPVRRTGLPLPTSKAPAHVSPIPEEISPVTQRASTPQQVDGKSSREQEPPFIDSKYLAKRDDVISIRGLTSLQQGPVQQSQTSTTATTSRAVTPPQPNTLRLSQAAIVPKLGNKPITTQPPLASAYFPGSQNQQIQAQS
ncbi:spindle assembly abnormal protein 6 homolog [Ptychodera flava]|uniref:spindle assembly abnormal protein 6 homolog n=1 Tax=Ptychodera flava TaxID=63121 RepID=UPI00396A1BF3